MRRVWVAWHGPRQPRWQPIAARVTAAGLTALLAMVLLAMAGDGSPLSANPVMAGSDPIPVPPSAAIPAITFEGHAPAPVGTSDWQQIALPAPPGTTAVGFTPSPTDPATVYACTTGPHSGELRVWRSRDTGAHWSTLALPPLMGTWCQINVPADAPARVTLFSGTVTDYPACDANPLYLSDDGGDHWMRIAAPGFGPADAFAVGCMFWPTAHHLYFLYSYERGSRENPDGRGPQLSLLARSDDDGRTWVRADRGLGDDALFFAWQAGDENTLAAGVIQAGTHSSGTGAWVTHDAGASWRHVDTVPATNLVALPIPSLHPQAPFYAAIDDQVPSILFRLRAAEHTGVASAGMPLPPLPVPGASPMRMGLLQLFEETHDGRLLAFGVDPHASVPSEESLDDSMSASEWAGFPAQWLWIWDQHVGRWLVWPSPLPLAYRWGCGVCLEHAATWARGPVGYDATSAGTYLWVRFDGYRANGNVAYRVFIPDAPPGQLDVSP